MEYYDVVLAAIPALMTLGFTSGIAIQSIAYTTTILIAAVVSALIVGHALFIRSPTHRNQKTDTRSNSAEPDESFPTAD